VFSLSKILNITELHFIIQIINYWCTEHACLWQVCLPCVRTSAITVNSREYINLMFVDPCIIVQFIQKNPTRCNNVPKFYYSIFTWSSTCFGRHTAHNQEPKTTLAASGFAYMEGCWTCGCWTLSSNHTSINLSLMQNQRLLVQFYAPDDGRCVARNMLSFI
jgi:hypothetical protein